MGVIIRLGEHTPASNHRRGPGHCPPAACPCKRGVAAVGIVRRCCLSAGAVSAQLRCPPRRLLCKSSGGQGQLRQEQEGAHVATRARDLGVPQELPQGLALSTGAVREWIARGCRRCNSRLSRPAFALEHQQAGSVGQSWRNGHRQDAVWASSDSPRDPLERGVGQGGCNSSYTCQSSNASGCNSSYPCHSSNVSGFNSSYSRDIVCSGHSVAAPCISTGLQQRRPRVPKST